VRLRKNMGCYSIPPERASEPNMASSIVVAVESPT
jgi:hypothetical protein